MHIFFHGEEGIGKCKIAFEFARKVLGVENLKSSPDFKYIEKNEEKKDIVIEQIRKEIVDDVYTFPSASERKVYIIDNAECLNIAAQNAILKTLEEPPKYVVIILVATTVSKFLPTILSRVTNIAFNGIPKEELKIYLKNNMNITLSDDILDFVNGSIGLSQRLINNNAIDSLKDIDELYKNMVKKDTINSLLQIAKIDFNEKITLEYLEYILYKNNKYSCVKFIEKARNRLKSNGNYDIVIDNMVLKIIDHI